MPRKPPPTPRRPFPPASLVEGGGTATCFAPAHGVAEWVGTELLSDTGVIHNPDHLHLVGADIAYLWAASGFESKMRQV